MNFDKYFDLQYDESKYNCVNFVCDAYKDLFHIDIKDVFEGAFTGRGNRKLRVHSLERLRRLEGPISPSIALFQAGRKNPHVGIWINGRILHMNSSGVQWCPLENMMLQFNRVRFYDVK